MKKFIPFSKLLSRRILLVTVITITVLALFMISFVTTGLIQVTDAYFRSELKASNQSVARVLDKLDRDRFYQYMRRIDTTINRYPLFDYSNKKDDKEMWAYGIVIDSVGNYLYHPDKQRIAQETVIEPQTTLLLYTDGLNEAIDADLEMFSEDRIFDELNHAIQDGQLSPKALVERLTQAVHDFVGDTEQSDDLTMMAIHRK